MFSVEHPASRASLSFTYSLTGDKKEALHKSASSFEVTVAPVLGLVIPVYCRQTGFSSASINFDEKPMVETEPTVSKQNMAAKVPVKEDRARTLDDALLRVVSNFENVHDLSKQQSAAIKSFVSGNDTFVSLPTGHGKSLVYQLAIPLAGELRKHSELWLSLPIHPMMLVVSPLTALIEDQMRSCEVFGLKCVKLEEFKEGDSVDLLFSSPETLEKHYEVVSNVSENIFGVVIDETHCVVTW